MPRSCYGKPPPTTHTTKLPGKLIVIEGADGSGRSTQIRLLQDFLEGRSFPTTITGLKRSRLVAKELTAAMSTTSLHARTLTLLYASDFADQLEHTIIPALRAGFVVLADRYIFTLMARSIVRGYDPHWVRSIFSFALVPDLILSLKVRPPVLAERTFLKRSFVDYWESGQDIQRSSDLYRGFIAYQSRMQSILRKFSSDYPFVWVNGEGPSGTVHEHIRGQVADLLGISPQG